MSLQTYGRCGLLGAVISGGSAGCFGREAALSAVDNGDKFAYN
jgi:hypothetical protein